jgi:predicted nucleic acid-binding protein
MAGLIDSSVVIELERRGQPVSAVDAIAPGESLAMAAITVSELMVGVLRAVPETRRRQREAFVEGVIGRVQIVTFDELTARVHARLLVEMAAIGQSIGANDLLIAATAIAGGYAVITDNVRDLNRVPGLTVTRPAW